MTVTAQARSAGAPATLLRPALGEDWLAVVIAFAAMGLVVAGVRPAPPAFAWSTTGDLTSRVFTVQNLLRSGAAAVLLGICAGAGAWLLRLPVARFSAGFTALFVLTWVSLLIAGNAVVSAWGFEYVIFALALGLAIGNATRVPSWLRDAARSEFYIKIGLVFLGAGILFGDILQAGGLGLAQAVLVVVVVWFACFWIARRLRVDDELGAMLATAVSICGVSAAIAACGALQGDRKKLSYVTSLVLIVAAPMMVVMPQVITVAGMPDAVGGAWLGGTLDTSASVVAAGEMLGTAARDVGVVVKLSQNVLIGVAAFALTVWWTMRGARSGGVSAKIIWERFPKFVLGFLAASFIASFVLPDAVVKETRGALTAMRTVWFGLAFTSIGLETRFVDLLTTGGGRPAVAFLVGQAFNVAWTLLLAYLLFGGMFFPVPAFG